MSRNRRLVSDQDLQEAMERQVSIRVFQDDLVVDSGGIIVRFTDKTVVTQSGVSDITYHDRELCEFFEMRSR
ncbi:hypothetical protein [Paenibacillus alkalitolerans]|uniref:hypothetical protein n=1 Tax=Paenibacillus alkalitolerans TaxID=2799335 RepID=UPI0018F63910|nr:hypothetical protein [Paenibacillus alkalitolerans]